MEFITEDFMLQTDEAKELYGHVKTLPIIDYHCHLEPSEIFEDKTFENIVDLWLGADHYKWRAMRSNGISERLITGDGKPKEKFKAWVSTLENGYGNPLYHWTHLELKQIFNWNQILSLANWEEAYDYLNQFIIEKELSPRKLIMKFKVEVIGTTDSPLDNLMYHKKIKQEEDFPVKVLPTFRPDVAFISHPDFQYFIKELETLTSTEIHDYENLLEALSMRIDYFIENGCRMSDHSFEEFVYQPISSKEMTVILSKIVNKKQVTNIEKKQWQTTLFKDLCRLYNKKGIVTQVHFGALRNNNTKYFDQLGADIGMDSLRDQTDLARSLNHFLDSLCKKDELPKMIFYNLDPQYNSLLANTLANFQGNEDGIKGKLQFGAAWWFSDTKQGMINQLIEYSSQGILRNFVGMLTDSRSFLSYPRHDYFRRILCNQLGEWMSKGEIPRDSAKAIEIVENISYTNTKNYIGV